MTSFRNIYVADRSMHQKPRKYPHLGESRHRAVEETNSKWAFLKRLLEIEEEHDLRRQARERQERILKQVTVNRVISTNTIATASQTTEGDQSHKWFTEQVLTAELDDKEQKSSPHRLLPVLGNISRFSPEPEFNHRHTMRAASWSPVQNQHSSLTASKTSVGSDDKLEDISYRDQNVSSSHIKTNSRSNFKGLSSPEKAHSNETHASINSFHNQQNRLTSGQKKRRQLRLPPILLPRVYTVKPRPLKALEFPEPTTLPGPITETQWEDLLDCRYIRHTTPRARESFSLED